MKMVAYADGAHTFRRSAAEPERVVLRWSLPLIRTAFFVLAAAFIITPLGARQASPAASVEERDFLSRVRRLTVDGRRAGEGYWSKDGRQLVFQSEREPGNPFYQIYTMDLTTGETMRVSPGIRARSVRTASASGSQPAKFAG